MAFPILFVGFFSPSTSIDEMKKSIEKERNRFLPFSLKLFLIFLEKSGEKRQQHEAEQEMEQKKNTKPPSKRNSGIDMERYKKKFRKKFSLFLAKHNESRDVDGKLMALPCAAFRAKTAGASGRSSSVASRRHSPITAEAC